MNVESTTRSESALYARSVVAGRHVQLDSEAARVAIPRHGTAAETQVDLVRDGDVIQAIDVTCSCGQKIRLRCLYENS